MKLISSLYLVLCYVNSTLPIEASNEAELRDKAHTAKGCLVPNGNITLIDSKTKIQFEPGTLVSQLTSIVYSCKAQYSLDGNIKTNFCYNNWINPHPKCIKTCLPIKEHSIEVHCEYKGEIVDCDTNIMPGTIAKINCAVMYKKPKNQLLQESLLCQQNGDWNLPPFQCEQICGTLSTQVYPIINPSLRSSSQVPWHVGIYFKDNGKYKYICGGTIIQSKIIISAATCFWDEENSVKRDTSDFIVAAGKTYRDYYAKNETIEVQLINVSTIDIPFTFSGKKYDYLSDIAVLTLSDHIRFHNNIRPVCLPNNKWEQPSNEYIMNGIFASWGEKNTKNFSQNLNLVFLSSLDYNTCKMKIMKKNSITIPYDKFCLDNSEGVNICTSDTGAGLVAPREVNGISLYYLEGLLSNNTWLRDDIVPDCRSQLNLLFTSIQYYKELIDNAITNTFLRFNSMKVSENDETSGCLVPMDNVILTDSDTKINLKPGTFTGSSTLINYSCPIEHILEGPTNNFCDGEWKNSHPECIRTCSPIKGHTIEARCSFRREEVDCTERCKAGTSAYITCAPMYRKPSDRIVHEDIHCQKNGEWSYTPFECKQICGQIFGEVKFIPLSVGGITTVPGKVPWHVGIYSKKLNGNFEHICGGTIIESKIVISAAHCFWNEATLTLYDKSDFIVAAGRFYRDLNTQDLLEHQEINVSKIDIPNTFTGGKYSYLTDIAVLTLTDHIKFNDHIIPACLQLDHRNNQSISENIPGKVAGWGQTETYEISEILLSVKMFAINYESCKNEILPPEKFLLSDDKFCAKGKRGEELCRGESGGGFVAGETMGEETIYYLRGVLSQSARVKYGTNRCGPPSVDIFTNVEFYKQLIKSAVNRISRLPNSTSRSTTSRYSNITTSLDTIPNATTSSPVGCFVPFSEVIVTEAKTKKKLNPNTLVSFATSIEYSCPRKHVLIGNTYNVCHSNWEYVHPTCKKICPPIQSRTIEAQCYHAGKEIDCEHPIEPGTLAKIKCATMYAKPKNRLLHDDIYCQKDGEWNQDPYKCEQICGAANTNIPFSVNSQLTLPSQVPWHVGIYRKRNASYYEQICGGTIIQSKIIISAAHCFWDHSGSKILDKSKFVVTTGKFYRDFYAENEALDVQKINISKIDIPVTFNGAQHDFANDIAVLTLTNHIRYKKHIAPACLIWREQSDQYIQSNLTGIIAGWGVTDNGTSSTELRSVKLLSIDNYSCKTKITRKNDNIAGDKFCVETRSGKNVCPGDSGGGYVVPETINDETFYHLWGVVSNGIIPRGADIIDCNANLTTTFTNIQFYKDIVNNAIIKAY